MIRIVNLLPKAMASWLCVTGVLPAQAQTWSNPHLGGYLGVNYSGVASTFNAGYSMYVALPGRPQYAYYSSSFQASLQIGTWMDPQCNPGIYCDIEGGPGVGGGYGNPWCNTGFGIGAVAGNGFTNFANGVSSGNHGGIYGAAQISARLLFPPKLEMFRDGTSGQMVGYGYLALPLLPGQATTDGMTVPTGGNWWTLFFNTRNFQGPVAVVTPHFYAQVTESITNAAGLMLDSCWAGPNKPIANESHYVPAKEYDGPEGSYLRVEPVFAAISDGTNGSIALNSPTVYDQTALWNAAQQWFTNNGAAPVGPFNAHGAALQTLTGGSFGWGVYSSPLVTSGSMPMVMGTTMGFYDPDTATYGYKWGTNQVTFTQFANGTPAAAMPEYYQLQGGVWTPVSPAAVPAASQLASVSFDSGGPPSTPGTYTVPNDPVWTNYAAGPFQVRIDDGNVVTYYWYRFEDQPAIMKAGLTQAQRDQLQTEVVKIHSAWTNGGTYLAPPTMGTLADVDPALLVTPPPGLEVGYVPIATSEAWGGWVTNTWNSAASGNWSAAANWASTNAPADGGHSYYQLNFAAPGTYVVTNDLSNGYGYGGYAVNQISFAGAVTLTGNPISLTADVGSNPQINQNSGNGVVINTPLNLDVSTVLGGTGSGLVVISNVISGPWHGLTLNNAATWQLVGSAPNTLSGLATVNAGELDLAKTGVHALGGSLKVSGGIARLTGTGGDQIADTGNLIVSAGTFDLNGQNETVNGVQLTGGIISGGTGILTSLTAYDLEAGTAAAILAGAAGASKSTAGTVVLSNTNTYSGATTISAGTLQIGLSGSTNSVAIANFGFEAPTTSTYLYNPAGGNWTFSASSGICHNTFCATAPPQGSQAGFIQGTGTLSQTVTVNAAGFYAISFQAEGRGGGYGPDGVVVQVDGTAVGTWSASAVSQSAWLSYLAVANLTAGNHTLTFVGNNTLGGDKSLAIDNVQMFQPAGNGALPGGTAVNLTASGAVLDLAGTAQTIGSLAGVAGSSVINGNLTTGGNGTSTTFAGVFSGGGRLTKTGAGTLALAGTNTYTGSTTINTGTLQIGYSPVNPVTISNYSFETPTTSSYTYGPMTNGWIFDSSSGVCENTFCATAPPLGLQACFIQGNGTLSQSLTVSVAGPYTISFQAEGRAGTYGPDGVIVQVDGTAVGTWAASAVSQSQWQSYVASVTNLIAGSHTLTLAGNNTLGGDKSLAIDNVQLYQTAPGALPAGTAVNLTASGAVLDLNGTAQTIGSLTGVAGSIVTNGSLTVGGDGTSTTFAGVISGAGTLTKTGAGTLTLSGANTYTGATTIGGARWAARG